MANAKTVLEKVAPDAVIQITREPAAYSIKSFCQAHEISTRTFYRLRLEGTAPAMMKVRGIWRISKEAAAAWRRKREKASAA